MEKLTSITDIIGRMETLIGYVRSIINTIGALTRGVALLKTKSTSRSSSTEASMEFYTLILWTTHSLELLEDVPLAFSIVAATAGFPSSFFACGWAHSILAFPVRWFG